MVIEKLTKKGQGITLITLIVTIVVMLILLGVSVTVIIDSKMFDSAGDYTQSMENQIEDQKSLSNMVRNLYN